MIPRINAVPQDLNDLLLEEYIEIKKRYAMNDWGPGQLKGGRFAECVLRIFQDLLGEPITPLGTDIPSTEKTRILNLVQNHATIDDHVRQKIVPLVRLLLNFRNSRDAAHLGGFDANSMDTLFVMTTSTWILCELVRVYGGQTMPDAQRIIDSLSVREYPVIMEFDGEMFITRADLSAKQEVLVLLSKKVCVNHEFLFSKTKDTNQSRFREMLKKMVRAKLIGQKDSLYFIMPKGSTIVSDESLLSYQV